MPTCYYRNLNATRHYPGPYRVCEATKKTSWILSEDGLEIFSVFSVDFINDVVQSDDFGRYTLA